MNFEIVTERQKESWEGALLPETNEEYHKRMGFMSSSKLKPRIANAYNYIAKLNTPDEDKLESKALDLGSCVHEVLLTQDRSQFVIMPNFRPITEKSYLKSGSRKGEEVDRVVKTIKAQVEEFELENEGKRIITHEQGRRLDAMVDYINSKPKVMEFLKHKDTLFEQGYLYLDPITNEKCMFRADAINPTLGVILDLKTTQDASPYAFKKTIERHYYHVSAAHYAVGAERIYGRHFDFIFIPQESSYPYKVGLYKMTMGSMKKAIDMRRDLIRLIQRNREENYYPDFADRGVRELELSGYAFEIDEERV
jgi:hypothetical protein